MIEIFLSLILLIFLVFISGFILSTSLFKLNYNDLEFYEIGLLGIIFLVFLSFVFHFFIPLNELSNSLLFILLILVFIFKINKIVFQNFLFHRKLIFISFLVIFIMTLKYKPNEDYGYYHLPFIINLVSDKIIFGLSNLQPQFGWNSTWLNFSSIIYLPILKIKGTQLSNSILLFFVFCMFFKELHKTNNKKNISYLFILILSFYVIIKFSRISAHGFDFPANIYLLLSLFYFIKVFEEKNIHKINKYFILISCFSLFALTIKLSTFAGPILFIMTILIMYKKKIDFKKFKLPLIFCFFFFLLWVIQQFIFTGCLIPHFKFSCFSSLVWYTNDISKMISDLTGAVNKSFNLYKGDLSQAEYLQDFNWVSTWFERNKIELLEHLAAGLLPIIILCLINIRNLSNNDNKSFQLIKQKKLLLISLSFFTIFGLLIWFLKSPVIRFGVPYLFSFIFLFLVLLVHLTKIRFKKGVLFIFTLCLVFNLSKNLNRITKSDSDTYWPEILNITYSTKLKNELKINYPDSKETNPKTKLCWSIPYICSISKGKNLIFDKKFSYTFILSNS